MCASCTAPRARVRHLCTPRRELAPVRRTCYSLMCVRRARRGHCRRTALCTARPEEAHARAAAFCSAVDARAAGPALPSHRSVPQTLPVDLCLDYAAFLSNGFQVNIVGAGGGCPARTLRRGQPPRPNRQPAPTIHGCMYMGLLYCPAQCCRTRR